MILALLLACARPAPVVNPVVVPPWRVVVPVPFNHDLFVDSGGAGAHFRMVEWADLSVGPWNVMSLQGSPDALDLAGVHRLPVGASGRSLVLVTAGYGGLDSKGVAAEGEIVYADDRRQTFRFLVGEHAWPAWAGASGRGADVLVLGKNAGGDTLTASVRELPLSFPGEEIREVAFSGRAGLNLYLLGMTVNAGGFGASPAADEAIPEGYRFPVPLALAELPGQAPAALHGRVIVDGEDLKFESGKQAKFWGVNLVGRGALPAVERAASVAQGLAARGFNLVRLHHIDSEATLLNPRRLEVGQPLASPEALDRLDRFHAALRDHGVYSFVEMWTQRGFVEGEGVPGPVGVPVGNKYVGYAWPEWREAQKAWFKAVWDRKNPYTGVKYADDPAVAFVELSNENSVLVAWSSGALERLPVVHRRKFDALWNAWLKEKYGSDGAISAAWAGSVHPGLDPGETLAIGTIAREPAQRSRTEVFPTRRAADLTEFYAGLERSYYAEMAAFVRELGFTAPLVCGTAMGVPIADRQLGACDVIDTHAYWDPIGESTSFNDTSLLSDSSRWLERLAVCHAGKPCTLSEINTSWPNRYAHEAPLTWATIAARQGFDAVLWFAWSHDDIRDLPDGPNGALDIEGRTSADVQMWSAGEVFRRLEPAFWSYTRWWSDAALQRDLAEPSSLPIPQTIGVRSWLQERIRVDFGETPSGETLAPHFSIPGSVHDNVSWSPGRLVIDSPTVKAVVGSATPTKDSPNPTWLRVRNDTSVAVSLVSLLPGSEAFHGTWLLTAVGRTDRVGSLWSRGVPGMLVLGAGPAQLERLAGFIHMPGFYPQNGQWLAPDRTPAAPFWVPKTSFGADLDLDSGSPQILLTTSP
ncbi:hypothetical protein LBMAG42_36150 [Deltaproteobacteria bacterium]|nr:hypothetical protein LBMAG42_36150 [Deltaproteobacteria bacterium]